MHFVKTQLHYQGCVNLQILLTAYNVPNFLRTKLVSSIIKDIHENETLLIYIYIYTPMITSQNSIRNISVATDEGPSPKLALSEGGSRGNIEG